LHTVARRRRVPHRAVVEEEVVEEGMCDNHASVCKLEDRSYPIRRPHLIRFDSMLAPTQPGEIKGEQ
jgi:hypothetical protein